MFSVVCRAFSANAGPYKPSDTVDVEIVRKKGIDLIHDPLFNKVYTSPPVAMMTIGQYAVLPQFKGRDSTLCSKHFVAGNRLPRS